MKKANVIMWVSLLGAAVMLAKTFTVNEDIKMFLVLYECLRQIENTIRKF